MPLAVFPSFSRGEIAPGLYGRVDTAIYHSGLRTARNVIIHASGGASNRPGLQFLAPAKHHDRFARPIQFKFKDTDTYVLEFGHLYMRVFRNDAAVVEATQTITAATQANPVVVTIAGHPYVAGDDIEIASVGGMTQLNGRRFRVANPTANTFELTHQISGANVNGTGFTAYTTGGTAARVYEITTPYGEADLETIKFVQQADRVRLTHPSYEPRELTRTGHAAWTLAVIDFSPTQDPPTGTTAVRGGAAGAAVYRYRVTAIADETLEESLPSLNNSPATITAITQANPAVVTSAGHPFLDGEEVEIAAVTGMTELNGRRFIVDGATANTFELKGEDSTAYTAYSAAGTATGTQVRVDNGNATLSTANAITVAWTEAADAQRYAVYRQKDGLYGLIGETESASFVDDGKTPNLGEAPPRFREPFYGANNYPGAVSFYEQRGVFGGSNNRPDTSWYTQTGNSRNMSSSTPAQADDAITATLTSREVNSIRHYVPLADLLVLTSGEEWRVTAGEDAGFSAATLRQKPQSDWGSGHQRPATFGSTVVYVTQSNASVRALGYALQTDGYAGPDLSITAAHMFRDSRVRDAGMAHAHSPEPMVVFIKHDGQASVLTFQQEQEVLGWARWDTPSGWFESACGVQPSESEPDEALYFFVRRTIQGRTVRYLERTASRRFADVQDCFFVDSGLSLDVPVAISGVSVSNPCRVTATAHGFANGTTIDIADIKWEPTFDDNYNETQPAQLNGYRYIVRNAAANTFQLEDEDGNAVDSSAFAAYVSGGTARAVVSTITNLHHLNDKAIVVLANGSVEEHTVTDGTITLDTPASRVHAGLRYISDLELLDMAVPGTQQTVQGRTKHLARVAIMVERTRGLLFGPNTTQLDEFRQRSDELYGEPTNLLTGLIEQPLPPEWNNHGRVFFRQKYPLPMTLLSVAPIFEVGD